MIFVLTGGVFLSILCSFLNRNNKGTATVLGLNVSINQKDLMSCLVRIMRPSHKILTISSLPTTVSYYKNCVKGSFADIPVHDPAYIENFYKRIVNEYPDVLEEMRTIIITFLKTDDESTSRLTRVLLEALSKDKTIPDDAVFYALPTGATIIKKTLLRQKAINLPAFLVGIWYYISAYHPDNSMGKEALENWLVDPDKNASRAGKLRDGVGAKIKRAIDISIDIPKFTEDVHQPGDNLPSQINPKMMRQYVDYLDSVLSVYSKVQTLAHPDYASDVMRIFTPTGLRKADMSDLASKNLSVIKEPNREAIRLYSRTVLIAASGGMGKSVTMRYLVVCAVDEYRMTGEYLPLVAELRHYNASYDSLENYLFHQNEAVWDYSPQRLQYYLHNKTTLVVLDGADEIPGDPLLHRFVEVLRDFERRYPKAQIIISSRNISHVYYLTGYKKLFVEPLNIEQAVELIRKVNYKPDQLEITENFLTELRSKYFETRKPLSQIPLMLVIMLLVFDKYRSLPTRMHKLYERLFEVMSHEFDDTKGGFRRQMRTNLISDQFCEILEELGARLYEADIVSFTKDQLDRILKTMDCIPKFRESTGKDFRTEDFLGDMLYSLCLFIPQGQGSYAFIHPSFREFFFASYLSRTMDVNWEWGTELIELRGMRMSEDNALTMLYDMRNTEVQQKIFLPTLHTLIKKCEDGEAVLTYLKEAYRGTINYTIGECKGDYKNSTWSTILNFILKLRELHSELDGDRVRNPNDFGLETEYYQKEGRQFEGQLFEKSELVIKNKFLRLDSNIDDIDSWDLYEDSPSWVGSVYVINVESLNPDENRSLYDSILGSSSPYYQEYMGLKAYLTELLQARNKPKAKSPFKSWL